MSKTHVAPISPDIGTEQQTQFEQQNITKISSTRDHAQYVHTPQTYQTSQQTNKLEQPVQKKKKRNTTNWIRII